MQKNQSGFTGLITNLQQSSKAGHVWALNKLDAAPAGTIEAIDSYLQGLGINDLAPDTLGGNMSIAVEIPGRNAVVRVSDSSIEPPRSSHPGVLQPLVEPASVGNFRIEVLPKVMTLQTALDGGIISGREAQRQANDLFTQFEQSGLFFWDCKIADIGVIAGQGGNPQLLVLDGGAVCPESQRFEGKIGRDTKTNDDKYQVNRPFLSEQLSAHDLSTQTQKIAVFPPPRYTPDFAAKADTAIRGLGFDSFIPSQAARATQDYHQWQGSPEERAADIMEVLRNPEVGAIFSFGGSGTTEVVQVLKSHYRDEIRAMAGEVAEGRRAAPPLFGFSDATNLQHFLGQEGVVSPVHFSTELMKVNGNNLPEEKDMTPVDIADFQTIQKGMVQFLKEPTTESVQLRPVNHAATVTTQIKGGLTVYGQHDVHTDVGAVMGGLHSNILLIEAGQEGRNSTDGLREKLSTLKTYGKLEGLEAIIISQCDANGDARQSVETADISALQQVVQQEIGDSIPVLFGAPFGHPRNALLHSRPLPLYTDTTLSLAGEGATLNIAPTRSIESVREVAAQFATMPNPSRQNIRSVTPQGQITVNTDIAPMAFTPLRGSNQPSSDMEDQETMVCAMDMSGAMVRGAELTALKGKDLTGKNIVIHMPLPELPPDFAPDFWENLPPEQKDGWYCSSLQLALTELVQSGSLQGINSLTISANESLPEPSKQWLDDFSRTHFTQAPVFTTNVPAAVSNHFPDKELAILNHVSSAKEPPSHESIGEGAPPPPGHVSWAAMTRTRAAERASGSPPLPGHDM